MRIRTIKTHTTSDNLGFYDYLARKQDWEWADYIMYCSLFRLLWRLDVKPVRKDRL